MEAEAHGVPWCAGVSGSAGFWGLGADAGQAGTGKPRSELRVHICAV